MLLVILLFLFLVFLLVLLLIVGTVCWCEKNKALVDRNPIFGTLSVAAPFLGGVLVYLLICQANSFFVGLFMVPLSLICGVILAIMAWLRGERSRWLAWIGLLLNSTLLILVILGVLEGSPKADNEFMRQVNDTKAHTSAVQVKAVALPSLLKPGKDTDIPKEILSLPFSSRLRAYQKCVFCGMLMIKPCFSSKGVVLHRKASLSVMVMPPRQT